jgi:hypothetical protein
MLIRSACMLHFWSIVGVSGWCRHKEHFSSPYWAGVVACPLLATLGKSEIVPVSELVGDML